VHSGSSESGVSKTPLGKAAPGVFENVGLKQDPNRILQFEVVLNDKWIAVPSPDKAGLATHPDQGLKEEVPPYLHILRCASRLATAKNDVLARGFEVIVEIL